MSEGEVAERSYRDATDHLIRTSMRLDLARAHLNFGEWLRRGGRRVDARKQLRSAYDLFESFGAEAFAARSARELAATGERVRRRAASSVDEMTATSRSRHPGGVNILKADGTVHFISDNINLQTWQSMGAISGGDVARLTQVKGVGRKIAERLALELREKITALPAGRALPAPAASAGRSTIPKGPLGEVYGALLQLGFKPVEFEELLGAMDARRPVEELVREALNAMRRK